MATEKRLIDANGSYTLNANDNTEHSLAQKGRIVGKIIDAIDITINSPDGGKCDITIAIKR